MIVVLEGDICGVCIWIAGIFWWALGLLSRRDDLLRDIFGALFGTEGFVEGIWVELGVLSC